MQTKVGFVDSLYRDVAYGSWPEPIFDLHKFGYSLRWEDDTAKVDLFFPFNSHEEPQLEFCNGKHEKLLGDPSVTLVREVLDAVFFPFFPDCIAPVRGVLKGREVFDEALW